MHINSKTIYNAFRTAALGIGLSGCASTLQYDYRMELNDSPLILGQLSGSSLPYCVVANDGQYPKMELPPCEDIDLKDFDRIETPVAPINGYEMESRIQYFYKGREL